MRQELGVYLVGAIGPADRTAVDLHLAGCPACRAELAGLAGLPALLGRVAPSEADTLLLAGGDDGAPEPPPRQDLGSLLVRAAALRRNRRWRQLGTAVAAGLVVGAGVVAGSHAVSPPVQRSARPPRPVSLVVTGSNPQTAASATVRYAPRSWGLELHVKVSGVPAGTTCWFDVTNARGQQLAAGSWTVAPGDSDEWYWASSSVPLSGLRGFLLTAGGKAIVRVTIPSLPALTRGFS
jgi:hypothetical protein